MISAVLILALLPSPAAAPVPTPDLPDSFGDTINLLAHPALRGREAGTAEADFAAQLVGSWFAGLGLKPWGSTGLLREFTATVVSADIPHSSFFWDQGSGPVTLRNTEGVWLELSGIPPAGCAGPLPVVFAGYGIRAPEAAHDDYAGLDVRGKAVLVWTGEPPGKEGRSAFSAGRISRHALVSTKIEAAQRAGASLMLVAAPPGGKPVAESYRRTLRDKLRPVWVVAGAAPAPPVVYVEEQLVSAWFAAGGVDSGSILSTATPGNPVGRPLSGIQVGLEWAELKTVTQGQWNVVGVLPGRNPLAEPVVLSAHYDHIGYDREADGSLTIYPGADDNASGVAALLGVAGALTRQPALSRPVVFAVFGAEEKGALGSRSFVEEALAEGRRFHALVNLDMVGRDNLDREDYRQVVMASFTARAAGWAELVQGAAEAAGLEVRKLPYLRPPGRSDDTAFAEREIPSVMLFTGSHQDYNTPGDTPARIRLEKVKSVARMARDLIRALAEMPAPFPWDKEMKTPPPSDPWDRPY